MRMKEELRWMGYHIQRDCRKEHTVPPYPCNMTIYIICGSIGGGALRHPVPKWLFFLNYSGEWLFTACVVFFHFSFGTSV